MNILGGTGADYNRADNIVGTDDNDVVRAYGGNDVVAGLAGIDRVYGDEGNDTLYGGGGSDILFGGADNDLIDGGSDADHMEGGAGNDTYYVDNTADVILEVNGGGEDTVRTTISYRLGTQFIEQALLLGSFNGNLLGNALANTLTGNSGNNGLNGGTGADTMIGGAGNDSYFVDNIGDIVTEFDGQGIDTIITSIAYDLTGKGVENATLTGSASLNLTGNSLDNVLIGNSGANTLLGAAGDDVLDGVEGADTLTGGFGNDTYYVDNAGDIVNEVIDGGMDTVITSISYDLSGKAVENATLTGTDNLNLTGNTLNNILTGNSGNNTLNGGNGDDVVNGGAGADIMTGGFGNDTYYVDNVGDTVNEVSGAGTDTVISSIAFDLAGKPVENVTLTGSASINLAGNTLDNILIGNSGANTITGNAGNDVIDGGAGADTMTGGVGNDTYYRDSSADLVIENAGGGIDTVYTAANYSMAGQEIEIGIVSGTANVGIVGNSLSNTLTGNSGSNILRGGAGNDIIDGSMGADTLQGDAGEDTFYVDNVGDIVLESKDGGYDTVMSSVSFSAGNQFIENITLTGTVDINATGNAIENTLVGNSGNNVLNGGTGADQMRGGLGNDTYYIDNAGDMIGQENDGTGIDTVYSSVSYAMGSQYIEFAILTGTANTNLTGNSIVNNLMGNSGNNRIDGGLGADIMAGGAGDDTFVVDNVDDKVTELNGNGTDTVLSSVNFSIGSQFVENLTLTGSGSVSATGNALANTLTGNSGANYLTGGSGADIFIFLASSGADTIGDFNAASGDKINVHAYGLTPGTGISQSGTSAVINLGGGNTVTIINTDSTSQGFVNSIIW